ncbi:MAG: indolepyruvate oxidoreductase subunit beta family protein [Candidatus Rokubacteria bacterium]|nr:indolepyruvate oxidoreductase subunit beta family protein [Candidatus Rokubacteria bacterium]
MSDHRDGPGPSTGSPGLVSVLIPAVGGQGGGVLSEWIVEAAIAGGLGAHGTSIPGVAQRTGSTTYYVEVFPAGDELPTVSLYPIPGALDVLVAPELLEVGRMIELGFPSPARTTIITSTHRLYSIQEKMAVGDATYPKDRLVDAARAFSRELHAFDALTLAREHRTEVNAILLGVVAGSGVLPIPEDAYRAAIRGKGVQVDANVRGFDLGLALARDRPVPASARNGGAPAAAAPVVADDPRVAALPAPLRPIVRQALVRLVDYQDARYAERYLALLRPFVELDPEVAAHVARYLALWMTYEDAIRVADLKTRASRFDRIRGEARAPGAVVHVTDYLKPDLDEIYGILPRALVAPFAHWAERRWPHGRPTMAQHVRTDTILGFLRIWLLGRLRRLRPVSYRAHVEHARMAQWLAVVRRCAAWDVALAREVAHAGQLVKGYGEVRRRMSAHLERLLTMTLAAAERASREGADFTEPARLARDYRTLVLSGPEGEAKAEALASV